jgi:predicted ArsR family transcriptional regulator
MLLATRPHTIEELAKEISVTKNAVRAQIAFLVREGIVEIQGMFKSARRPGALYGLSPGSDLYFSRAYPVVLSHLIHVLANQLSQEAFMAVMQELGQCLARSTSRPSGDPQERIRGALKFLKALGSPGQMTEEDGKVIITSLVCPIARAVAADTRVCTAMETLLRELTGLAVEERCNRSEQQGCRFIIKVPRDNKLPLRPRAGGKALK